MMYHVAAIYLLIGMLVLAFLLNDADIREEMAINVREQRTEFWIAIVGTVFFWPVGFMLFWIKDDQ
jgi:hypothetical protein